jgi:membrane fusion protein (multidrug efflux system)
MLRSTVCLLPFLTLAFAACSDPAAPDNTDPAEASAAPARVVEPTLIETMVLVPAMFSESIELVGETEPLREANLSAEMPGRIVRMDVIEGQEVTAGQTVLRLDTSIQSASIGQIEAQLRQVEADIERNQRLVERGIGTASTVEQLETQRDVLQENIAQIRTGVRQGTTASPITGLVVDTMAEEGEYASPGQPLARIIDISSLIVRVGLPEREITYVAEGMPITVRIEATGEVLQGRLTRISAEANRSSRTFPLEITNDNASRRLRAGMRASVIISKREIAAALVVPRDAILQGISSPEAYVYDGSGVEVRELSLGPGRGGFVVVESGLTAGDAMVVRGHRGLVPGESVRANPLGECCAEQFAAFLGEATRVHAGDRVAPAVGGTPTQGSADVAPEAQRPAEASTEGPNE